jgi:NADH-quinone oxidoreductase subunit L
MHPSFYMLVLPLVGGVINAVLGLKLPRRLSEIIACASIGISFVFSILAFRASPQADVFIYNWLSFSWFSAPFALRLDALSLVMSVMVTGVSFLIHLYSVWYMRDDHSYARYFSLLNLFVFSMLLLVTAHNLPLMFVGWEGVGFCSYALIGFWYEDPANADAGRKAFIVTRLGDVAFGVALVWLFYFAGSTDITFINQTAAASMPARTAFIISILLLVGAAGKSAQLPLTVWLPDAMAGPTPVSALIHAATMVTAGAYLLIRMFPVIRLSEEAMMVIAGLGAITAFYAATAALYQRDIKRVLAYSTISQIGYMVVAVGAGSISASLFHLVVHAFFKSLLFMGAGCIIQAMHEEHDIFKMGGLAREMPLTFACFLAGALALAAAPGTGGFFSKDAILSAAFMRGGWFYYSVYALLELTALLTALYIFRVVFVVFTGPQKKAPARIPWAMPVILVPLAILSIVGGALDIPAVFGGSERLSSLLRAQGLAGQAVAPSPGFSLQVIAALVFLAGLAASYYFYVARPEKREAMAIAHARFIDFMGKAWRLDELYYTIFVRPYRKMADILWMQVDEASIDASLGKTGEGFAALATWLRRGVTGKAAAYISSVAAGAAIILIYFLWGVK